MTQFVLPQFVAFRIPLAAENGQAVSLCYFNAKGKGMVWDYLLSPSWVNEDSQSDYLDIQEPFGKSDLQQLQVQ